MYNQYIYINSLSEIQLGACIFTFLACMRITTRAASLVMFAIGMKI